MGEVLVFQGRKNEDFFLIFKNNGLSLFLK